MRMTGKSILFAGAALAGGCAGPQQAPPRPNVVFILADDLGYGDLGCYGARGVETPRVDGLARQGVRCTDAHAVASTSTPSRYALLTGQYPWRKAGTDVAAGNAGMIIGPEQYTVADLLKEQGYRTGAVGKWHLGLGSRTAEQDWNGKLDQDLADLGFDYHYIMAATADRVPCVYIENGRVVNHDPENPIEVSYKANFEGEPTGRDHPELLYNLKSSHGHDMSIVNGIGRIGYMKGGGKALWKDEDIADSLTRHAVQFIEESAGRPFFLFFATNDVHVPRFPAERFRGASTMGLRGDAIAQFDWSVGVVLETLERLGLQDNTIVILTSDNGPVLDDGYQDGAAELVGEHSPTGHLRGGKYSTYEGGTAVPLIVRWPGHVAPGTVSDRLISHVDGFRSLADLLGVSLPEGAAPDSRPWTEATYAMEMSNNHTLSVCDARWKYISPSDGPAILSWCPEVETGYQPSPQLYDRTVDRGEQVDMAVAHPELIEKYRNIINDEL